MHPFSFMGTGCYNAVTVLNGHGIRGVRLGGYPNRRATEMAEVQCVKCGKAGEQITDPLFMGRLESEIKANVCKSCWREWEGMKVMVINEYQVNLGEESGRELVKKHMRAFLKLGEAVDNSKLQQSYRPVQ